MSIVSIGEELRGQQLKQILDALSIAYASTFEDLRRFAVDWDAAVTEEYRSALAGLAGKAAVICQTSRLSGFQTGVRATLESHKRRAEEFLAGLEGKLSQSAEALARLVTSLASGQQNQDQELNNALAHLRCTADLDDIVEVRRQIVGLTATLTECVAGIRRQNSLVIAQLTDEINLLHRQIGNLQSAGRPEREEGLSGSCTVAGLPATVEDWIVSDRPFSLLLVRVQNLDAIRSKDGPTGAAEVAGYCLRKMTDLKMPISHIGVWNGSVLAALLTGDCGQLNVGNMITGQLGGVQSIAIEGIPRKFDLRVSTALLKRPIAEARDRTYQRLGALLQALG